jgi:hypothetical protein
MKDESAAILAWVTAQNVLPGTVRELTLPPALAHTSHNGVVQAARMTDGSHCVLSKKHVGWKDNYEGLFFCERPLNSNELVKSPTGTAFISLGGLGIFEELYVRRRHSDNIFEVYFDLN